MGTTRLQLYNDALMLCGERFLATLSEEREPRRLLDRVWDSNGVSYCLEQGQWQFAMRTQQVEYDPSTEPPFGYRRAFNKPDDWVLTSALCSDEYFRSPLLAYSDELEFWYADLDTIYVKFVSDDEDYGSDLSIWPATFCDYAAAYFASKIISKLAADRDRVTFLLGAPGDIDGGELGRRLKVAKSRAAMTGATTFPAQGSWSRSRYGTRGDRGNRNRLIG